MKSWMLISLMAILSVIDVAAQYIPKAPDYSDATMWVTSDGDALGTGADVFYVVSTWEEDWQTADGTVCHYADVWNPVHREHMAREINRAAAYMSKGNRFYAPYYRHTTIDAWVTQNEDTLDNRLRLAMADVCEAFDLFQQQRDKSRPLIIAGFSQGGRAVVELLKHIGDDTYQQLAAAYVMGYKVTPTDTATCHHIRPAQGESDTGVIICYNTVKDVKYIKPVISGSCFAINPVNWRTDATPAVLHDSITVTLSPEHHVLVVSGYSGAEYPPYKDFINVGDIHSCEPWLYSDCIEHNMAVRTGAWRTAYHPTVGMSSYETHGLEKSMPVFYQLLKDSLRAVQQQSEALGVTRARVLATMQMAPPAPKDYNYEVIAEEQRDGYVAQKIAYNINRWEKVLAYLLIPASISQGREGILLLHDHGAHFTIGKEKMVRPFGVDSLVIADADEWVRKCYDGVYVGDELAKRGYVVLCTDALFWGDRTPLLNEKDKEGNTTKGINRSLYERQQALASNMMQMGTSWGAWITWDDIRSAEFLAHLPMVNPKKVGCLGFSMGAYRSWMLAALSDDIKASASICWMNDTEHLMTLDNNQNKGGSAYSMLIPGIRNIADYPQVAALAAPKASLFFNGKKDKLFPVSGVEMAYGVMHKAWKAHKAERKLVTKLWDEKHFFNKAMQQEVFEFFDKELK
jgi:dienelactone hydrolase